MTDELEAIRARHINNHDDPEFSEDDGFYAHDDRGVLLRLLDAAREENERLKEALGDAHGELCAGQRLAMQLSDWSIDAERCMERARAALAKDATTETKP